MDSKKVKNEIVNVSVNSPCMRRMSTAAIHTFQTGTGCNYDEFCIAVKEVGLPILANKSIFDVFDMDNSGTVSPSEFISTLALFHVGVGAGVGADQVNNNNNNATAAAAAAQANDDRTRLYFSLFDQDGNGTISRTELTSVVGMLMCGEGEGAAGTAINKTSTRGGRSPGRERERHSTSPSRHSFHNGYNMDPSDTLSVYVSAKVIEEIDDDNNIPDTYSTMNEEIDYIELFDAIDTDGSGEISYAEFSAWFNEGSHRSFFNNLIDPIDRIEQNLDHFYN